MSGILIALGAIVIGVLLVVGFSSVIGGINQNRIDAQKYREIKEKEKVNE